MTRADAQLTRDHDGNLTLTFQRRLTAPINRVWAAITDPVEMSQWYPFRVVAMDLQAGGSIEFEDDEANLYRARIIEFENGRRLAFCEEDADVIRVELVEADDGTLLTFTHTFAPGPPPERHAAGWHLCLENIAALATAKPLVVLERDQPLESEYAAIL